MASVVKGSSSRRKAAPGKIRIVMKGPNGAASKISDDEDDSDTIEDDGSKLEENGIPEDLPEGTVVVQPEPVEEMPAKKKKEAPIRIDTSVLDNVSCTACGRQLNPYKSSALQKHPELKVIICRRCCKFLSSGDIAKDKDGVDEQCRWCGEGGRLVVCDDCSSAFCKACVMRNFNRSEFNNINGQTNWKCYLCDKSQLQGLRENYRNVRDTLKALQAKEKAKAERAGASAATTDSAPTSNGMIKSAKPSEAQVSKGTVSATTSSSSSSSVQKVGSSSGQNSTDSQKSATNSQTKIASTKITDEQLTILPSDLKVEPDNVDMLMDKLSTATDTFKGTLRALRAQFHPTSPIGDDEEVGQFHFTLSSRMNIAEKKMRCAKALNSTLQTYFKSLKVILTGSLNSGPSTTENRHISVLPLPRSSISQRTATDSSSKGTSISKSSADLGNKDKDLDNSRVPSKSLIDESDAQKSKEQVGEQASRNTNVDKSRSKKNVTEEVQSTESSKATTSPSKKKRKPISSDEDDDLLADDESVSQKKSNNNSKDSGVTDKSNAVENDTPSKMSRAERLEKRNERSTEKEEKQEKSQKGNEKDGKETSKKVDSSSEMEKNKDVSEKEKSTSSSSKSLRSSREAKELSDSEGSDMDTDRTDQHSERVKRKELEDKESSKNKSTVSTDKSKQNKEPERVSTRKRVSFANSGEQEQTKELEKNDEEKKSGSTAKKVSSVDSDKTKQNEESGEKGKEKESDLSSKKSSLSADKTKETEEPTEKNKGRVSKLPFKKSSEKTGKDEPKKKDKENESDLLEEEVSSVDKEKSKPTEESDKGEDEESTEDKSDSSTEPQADERTTPSKSSSKDSKKEESHSKSRTGKKDSPAVESASINDDENMAAKLDLIKELAEEMLRENEKEDESNEDDNTVEGEHSQETPQPSDEEKIEEVSVKSSKKRKKSISDSSDEEKKSAKSFKTSERATKKSPKKKPEPIEISDASSSDILWSSDEDESPTRRSRRKTTPARKDKTKEDITSTAKGKSKTLPSKDSSSTTLNKRGKGSSAAEVKNGPKDEDAVPEKKEEKKKRGRPAKKGKVDIEEAEKSSDSKTTKSKVNGKKEEDDQDEDDKEIEKLAKLPVLRKKKTAAEADEDKEEDEEKKEETRPTRGRKAGRPVKNKPGPKSSKKDEDFEDLSSDGNEEKMDDEDEDEEEDEPKVSFFIDEADDQGEADIPDENELAKNGLLEEIANEDEDDDDSDKSSTEEDSDEPKSKKKDKKTGKNEKKKKTEEKDDNDDDEDSDAIAKRRGNRKTIKSKLLDTKLSDSDSDVGTSRKKAKSKKEGDEDFDVVKEDKSDNSSDSSIESDLSDDDEDDSEKLSGDDNDEEKKSKKKRKRKGKKKGRKKKGKKGAKADEDEEKGSQDEDEEDGEKKGKGKKRRRIKKMSDSSDDDSDNSDSDDESKNTPGRRKKIRKVMSNKKLEDSTKAAAKAEEKRRKRIAAKQREFNIETITDENNPMNCPITTKLVLEPGKEEGDEPVIQVNKVLVRKLKPHQVEAVQFMWDCMYESVKRSKKEAGAGCILAHCMGLGKTLSVISFVHTIWAHREVLGHNKFLVVCPLNTVLNWQNEWSIWLEEEDRPEVWELAGCKQNPARADALKEWHEIGGIMIMGYEMYRNLTTGARIKNKRQKKIFQDTLVDPGPDLVVCDEGHILKNEASAVSKAMNQMKTRRRVVLTGTPLQNNLNEYHCMVSFVKPNLLGTRKEFNNRFISPIQNGQCTDSTLRDVKLMKARAHVLHEMLAGCVQRRDYSALTKFLPPKQEYVISVRLTDVQIDLYNKYMELSGQGVDGVFNNKGARLFKDYQNLMKIWTHPWVLKLAEIRDEMKMKLDDEDSFIDDDSMDERSFSSSESSDEEKYNSDSGGEGTSLGAGQKRGTRRTRAKARRQAGEDSDPEEVIAEWKSKTRGQNGNAEEEEEMERDKAVSNDWWAKYVSEEDQTKLELSNKLFLLFEILRMCEEIGDKVLIFSQSILSLNIIESFLETVDSKFQQETEEADKEIKEEETFGRSWTKNLDYYRMDGSTSAQNRQAWAQNFNDLENYRTRLFLISTKAGGLGINLVAANRVIIFDASWNPSHDVQSIFRVYRFGQTKPCYIYRFLAQGTMEEKIYERQVTKLSLSQRVVDEHQIERHFSASDLKELYNFRPDKWDDGEEKPTLALPKDPLLAEILKTNKHTVVSFHEHDSLLENQVEQTLTEEEKKAAWEEYENEKKGIIIRGPGMERTASWPMMAAAQILSREQITATVQALRQQLPDVSEELFQLHVQQALRRMVQLKQEEMRRIEMMRMQQMNYYNMMKQEAGLSHAQSMAALHSMQSMDPWMQIQRLRAMQSQMQQGASSSSMLNAMMGMSSQQISNDPEDAIDLDLDASPSK